MQFVGSVVAGHLHFLPRRQRFSNGCPPMRMVSPTADRSEQLALYLAADERDAPMQAHILIVEKRHQAADARRASRRNEAATARTMWVDCLLSDNREVLHELD